MDPLNPTIEDLDRQFEITAPASRISKSLRSLVAEGNVNPDEIISLIRLEPLLATRILREANQLATAPNEGYCSIEESVTAIGFKRMYDLLGLYSHGSDADDPTYSTDMWKRAITCAVCMENLADKHRLKRQTAYAIGLTHSLAAAIFEANQSHPRDFQLDSQEAAELTEAMMRNWSLPVAITDPVRFQYNPLDCQTTGKMACLLNLSKWITGVVREVDELPEQAAGPDVLILNLLGEGEQTLWNLVTDVSDSLHQADAVVQGNCPSR